MGPPPVSAPGWLGQRAVRGGAVGEDVGGLVGDGHVRRRDGRRGAVAGHVYGRVSQLLHVAAIADVNVLRTKEGTIMDSVTRAGGKLFICQRSFKPAAPCCRRRRHPCAGGAKKGNKRLSHASWLAGSCSVARLCRRPESGCRRRRCAGGAKRGIIRDSAKQAAGKLVNRKAVWTLPEDPYLSVAEVDVSKKEKGSV